MEDAAAGIAERTAQVDQIVLRAASELLLPAHPAGLAILAVGGYGRRQLFPYSDVDLLLLFASERAAQSSKAVISPFLQQLWDSGLRLSHSVRTPEECAEVHDSNTELNISLLDQRYLTGDRVLYADLARRMPKFIHGNRDALIRNLAQLTRERHNKFAGTIHHLEPNIKESPGGLRDHQLVCWLQQLRDTDAAHVGSANPGPELEAAFRYIARLRCQLHARYKRDNNVLSFEAQDAVAESWGGVDASAIMREYYRHSRAVFRAALRALDANEGQSSALFAQFRNWRARVGNTDFSVHGERVHLRAPQVLANDPDLVLRLFEFVARHGFQLSQEAEQRIEARLPQLRAHFAEPRPLWPALAEMLTLPHAPMAIRAMQETGILTAIFPEMEQIECLVVRDFYHRYTVDEHTLVAIQKLMKVEDSYAGLLAEVRDKAALMLALLFHDSGKGTGEGHVEGSIRLARSAMARIGVPANLQETVVFLIQHHLELSAAMQSRDVFDPETIRAVAGRMETVERLKALTLLTYADISAVNPEVMTPWRSEQLWQLYLMVYNELTRGLETDRIEAAPSGPPERTEFLRGFPMRYLRTHTEQEIDEHVALEARSRKRGAAVDIRRLEWAWQMTLVAEDRTGLFASAAGTLAAFGMNILRAEAFSNRRGRVLDTFIFADPIRTLELNPEEVDRLRSVAERVILGKTDVKELLRNRPKPVLPSRHARIPARVSFNSEASNSATLVEIVAEDRPGLLYDLASAISSNGGNIEVVLIDTQAHKAIDVFYVTADGKKLKPEKQAALAEALRRACGAAEAR